MNEENYLHYHDNDNDNDNNDDDDNVDGVMDSSFLKNDFSFMRVFLLFFSFSIEEYDISRLILLISLLESMVY